MNTQIPLIILIGTACLCFAFDPYTPGPYTPSTYDIYENETGLLYHMGIITPNATGHFPIFYFFDGFGSLIPTIIYDMVLEHIASFGFIVVNSWRFVGQPWNSTEKVPFMEENINWCKTNLESYLYSNGITTDLTIDFSMSFAGSHSAGSPMVVNYIKAHCHDFKGIVLTSPVDSNSLPQTGYLDISIPTYVMAAGLDPVPPPCAPASISNIVFYDAFNGSNTHKWFVNATDFGHADYLDQGAVDVVIATGFCAYNENATVTEFDNYRRFTGGQIVTFIKAILSNGNCSEYIDIMENTSGMPVSAIGVHEKPSVCPTPYCTS